MFKPFAFSLILSVAAVSSPGPLAAQARSTIASAELEAAVTTRPIGNRDAVRALLRTEQAQGVADRMGLDAELLSAQVASLDQASLDRLVEESAFDGRILVGGDDKIVISTTAVIIGLLILILITD